MCSLQRKIRAKLSWEWFEYDYMLKERARGEREIEKLLF